MVLNNVVSAAVVCGMFTYRLWGTGGQRTRLRAAMSKGCHSRPRCQHHSIRWSGLRRGDLGQGGGEARSQAGKCATCDLCFNLQWGNREAQGYGGRCAISDSIHCNVRRGSRIFLVVGMNVRRGNRIVLVVGMNNV